MTQEALDRGVGVIRKNYEASAAKGRFTQEKVEAMMGLLTPSLSFDDLADCDLVIEAVYESMEVKKDVFGKLDTDLQIRRDPCVQHQLSGCQRDCLGNQAAGQDVLGMHFFSPANVMKLLEVVRGEKTADDVLATAMAIGKKIGKVAVVAGVCDGFIGNRMLSKRQQPANDLLMEGATPEQIDNVFTEFGFPMGPFQMGDLAGLDIGWHRDMDKEPTKYPRRAVRGRGAGARRMAKAFTTMTKSATALRRPKRLAIIEEFRSKSNKARRDISDQEIVERCLYPMVNEGHLILEEGMAQRASDIDVVWIYGYGWPIYRGGPMFWGGLEGAGKIVEALERHGVTGGRFAEGKGLIRKRIAGELSLTGDGPKLNNGSSWQLPKSPTRYCGTCAPKPSANHKIKVRGRNSMFRQKILALLGALALLMPAQAMALQCVPYARQASGVQIFGNAKTWWMQAAGRYERGSKPKVGAVMSFKATSSMPLGHVGMVSKIVSDREVLIDHANWSTIGGRRGPC